MFQSTRPRGARLSILWRRANIARVSIHAPARGATALRRIIRSPSLAVSIHAPARGATRYVRLRKLQGASFNPRAREGRDRVALLCSETFLVFQSTRPRGARLLNEVFECADMQFQSTRPRGARHDLYGVIVTRLMFQSTRPRGARRSRPRQDGQLYCFNPRAREGRDNS